MTTHSKVRHSFFSHVLELSLRGEPISSLLTPETLLLLLRSDMILEGCCCLSSLSLEEVRCRQKLNATLYRLFVETDVINSCSSEQAVIGSWQVAI